MPEGFDKDRPENLASPEKKEEFLDSVRALLDAKLDESGGNMFTLSDGRDVHVFILETTPNGINEPLEEIARVDVYNPMDDDPRKSQVTSYVLRKNGALERFSNIHDPRQDVDPQRHPEEAAKQWEDEVDAHEVAEKADRAEGIAEATESETQEAIDILEILLREKEN